MPLYLSFLKILFHLSIHYFVLQDIFDNFFEFSESDSLIVLPQYYSDYLKEHYDSSAERSIIAYCEMVAHRKIEMDKDVNIVTLFNNEDIQKILEINGLM